MTLGTRPTWDCDGSKGRVMTCCVSWRGMLLAAGVLAGCPGIGAVLPSSRHDFRGAPVTGTSPASAAAARRDAGRVRAALVWNLRAALNVAALQCQFAPTLLTVDNYNAMLNDHAPS